MCVFVSRAIEIDTFPRKTVRPPNGLLIFFGKTHIPKNMEIVEDFACEAKFLHFFIVHHFSSFFFLSFFIFSFSHVFHVLIFSSSFCDLFFCFTNYFCSFFFVLFSLLFSSSFVFFSVVRADAKTEKIVEKFLL